MIVKKLNFLVHLKVRKKIEETLRKSLSTLDQNSATLESKQIIQNDSKSITWRLFASVCIERTPIMTCDMNDLEKRYSSLINQLNIRKSMLSDHELRHLKDLENAKKKKLSKETDSTNIVIETAVDYEDKCLNNLNSIEFSERKTSNENNKISFDASQSSQKPILKNLDRILDKKLILLVYDPKKFIWQLPKCEWKTEDDSLRNTAERTVIELNKNLKVEFLGNAPVSLYKLKKEDKTGEKQYIFKAQYKSGGDLLAESPANNLKPGFEYAWIRKDELPDFIKNKDYLECLNDFILDF